MKGKNGFTLVELLAVIIILGLIAVLIVPKVVNMLDDAEKNTNMTSAENLIKAKGFENLVIFVNDDSISVIVKSNELEQEKVAQIQNIISRELKVDADKIHISNK